ncbi:hypothetical protein ANCCAN_28957, partial [Ancylostoma caninum]
LDNLITVVTEIEASLNTRPLTYQEAELEHLASLRPIDFIQKEMVVTYPFDAIGTDAEDPDYQPATAQGAVQTRKQAEEALQSSYAATRRSGKPGTANTF